MQKYLFVFAILCLALPVFTQDDEEWEDPSGMTDDEIQQVLDIHNEFRASVGGSNIEFVTWNPELGRLAKGWSENCEWKHGQIDYDKDLVEYDPLGQNLHYTGLSEINIRGSINSWFKEKEDYNFEDNSCDGMCGHYTQVVWSKTEEVGCGYHKCETMTGQDKNGNDKTWANVLLFTCNYGPAGNMAGVKPFVAGNPCTKCTSGEFWCFNDECVSKDSCDENGLDCECKAECQNGGVQTDDCRCECTPGWNGVDCSEPCEDSVPKVCKSAPKRYCKKKKYLTYLKKRCAAKCGHCEKA